TPTKAPADADRARNTPGRPLSPTVCHSIPSNEMTKLRSKLQRPSGDRVKTDAKDALHLARLLRLDEFTAVKSGGVDAPIVVKRLWDARVGRGRAWLPTSGPIGPQGGMLAPVQSGAIAVAHGRPLGEGRACRRETSVPRR